jgi:hypothetical protein
VVEALGILLDETLLGPHEARRRAVRAFCPGVTVHRLGGGLLVRFPVPRWIDCARAPGLPMVRAGASSRAALSSAPLAEGELAELAPPDGAVVIVRGGVPSCTVPAADAAEDPAAYLDLSGFAPIRVTPLGEVPALPRVAVVSTLVSPRHLLGIADEPPQRARVLEALQAARRGMGPIGGERRAPFFARLFATLASLVARVFRARSGTPGRGLVVVPAEPSGSSLFQRFGAALRHLFASALVRADLAPFLGRRQAEYLGRMIDLFEQGDLSEALRHAIPLGGGEGGEGASPPMLGVPAPRQALSISGGGGRTGPSLFAPEDFYADLRRRYRAAFERLEREGRIEEAAFVLAELLRESAESVAFLERHGRLQLAAEVAEARGLSPQILVRQWLLAGETQRAVLLARRHGVFADAVAQLGQHPQAPVLRMLWAASLADAGDFAAAVEVAWPVPEARPTAEVWIDAALAQGGVAAARMLARKLALVAGSFSDVRDRSLALLDDATGSPAERRALAQGLLAQPAAPGAATLARAVLRALVRDGGRTEDPATAELVVRLEALAGDDVLRADRPRWPVVARTPLAKGTGARLVLIGAADTGATPIHDAAHLPDGRTLLALGEAGIRVLGPGGRTAFDLDAPAHRLVVSDRGDRALALARRGDAWRVARLDLIRRRAEVWCEARFDCTAPDFDGSQWVVAEGRRLLVIDALEARFDALASFDLGLSVARVQGIARTPTQCTLALEEPQEHPSRRSYELPSWTLRQQGPIDAPRCPTAEGRAVLAAGVGGVVAILADDRRQAGPVMLSCSRDGGPPLQAILDVPAEGARPLAVRVAGGWLASALLSKSGLDVRLHDDSAMKMRARIMMEGAGSGSIRLDAENLTVADDRGRLLVMELGHGGLVREARV